MVGVTGSAPASAAPPHVPTDAKELPVWCRDFSEFVVRQFRMRPIANTAQASAFLFSPDGAVWEVKVDNAGVIVTTKVKS